MKVLVSAASKYEATSEIADVLAGKGLQVTVVLHDRRLAHISVAVDLPSMTE
jgi:hypothetical protein